MKPTGGSGLVTLVVVLITIAIFVRFTFGRYRLRALLRAYRDAFDRGDADAAAKMRERIERLAPPSDEMRLVGDGEILLLRERWAEARAVLERIRRERLPAISRPGVLKNLAYATALAGDPKKGLALARQALVEAKELGATYPASKLTSVRATVGITLSLAERHDEAVEVLEVLVDEPAPPRRRAARAYFLAESLRATGKTERAQGAYASAAALEGAWADRARRRLR